MNRTFLRFAAVFVSFWQNPQTLSHFAIDRTPVVFHGGCRCPLLQVVLPNVPSSDIVRRARLRTEVGWRREQVIEKGEGTLHPEMYPTGRWDCCSRYNLVSLSISLSLSYTQKEKKDTR